MKPPLMDLPIETAESGFYAGFSKNVAVISKIIIAVLVIWAVVFPESAGRVLNAINGFILANTAYWYVWIVALFVLLCVVLAIWPTAGRLKLGVEGDVPEFSNFSWFSMMFGAGIGVGMLTWAVAEPMYHFNNNPEVIKGLAEGGTAENVRNAYKWSFLHWGFGAWACYAIAGLSLAFFCYRRGLPLTMRSSLTPIFGKSLSGPLGALIDIVAVVATILGVAQTLGFGVEQFVAGLTRIGIGGLIGESGTANTMGIVVAIVVIMAASTMSALSGVGKGIKWLSNLNMGLSIFLLAFFLLFGSTFFGLQALVVGIWDYLIALPEMMFTVWRSDGVEDSVATKLEGWQGGWSVFYWAWWIAFAPFVGLFLARISKGRTIREFVLGAIFVPSLMCFVWFTWAGGTAIDLELTGGAGGAISGASDGDKIFAAVNFMLNDALGWIMSVIIVVLLMTYLVTTADSAVLIVNTINAAGDEGPKARPHIYFWGIALGAVVAALLIAGGHKAITTAMVIGAFPFSVVMVLQCFALIKAIWNDGKREEAGVATTADAAAPAE
ncbi:Glycine betaine-Na(+) symporter [Cognatishimia activa]|uniref:Glycine betaine-Na(+) symporter n=3 Tax=Cognatishimia activa TaxID=1715691 RepID=A0A0P1IQP5_9RHOB|nr:Glycine betaine-Na(+) symporter [Cognatishimia activa]